MALVDLADAAGAGRDRLGGKAWSIARMLELGIPVPPAFVLTTDECGRFRDAGDTLPDDVVAALQGGLAGLEAATGRGFGDEARPLLVSVRSGAPTSMPGMMDTVLNLGMTPGVERGLADLTGDAAYAADTRRRFEEQYAEIVGEPPPADPHDQLRGAIAAVFRSWRSPRAVAYRERNRLPDDPGTAVAVQAMVFGNLDDRSGTGVLFTRDPLRGAPEPYGEWLARGQGEDVVSGRHDPLPLSALGDAEPGLHAELLAHAATLERDARDVQDVEFTVESGRLWLLQARAAKRTAEAAVRSAVVLEREGVASREDALRLVTAAQVRGVLRPRLDPAAVAASAPVATGRPACPGVATGVVVTDTEDAEDRALDGERIVLVRRTTNPDDVRAMAEVEGVLTELGGATSHAAVVSRELGVACVVGCGDGTLHALEGTTVTIDATAGTVHAGELPIVDAADAGDPDLATLAAWAAGPGEEPSLDGLLAALEARDRDA